MNVYGRQNGRGMAHILVEVQDNDRGVAACGAPLLAIQAETVPAGTVCPTCLSYGEPPFFPARNTVETVVDLEQRIGLPGAARVCGLALSSLQQAARLGRLQTEQPSPKVRLTTRQWLQDYLESRPERFKRR